MTRDIAPIDGPDPEWMQDPEWLLEQDRRYEELLLLDRERAA